MLTEDPHPPTVGSYSPRFFHYGWARRARPIVHARFRYRRIRRDLEPSYMTACLRGPISSLRSHKDTLPQSGLPRFGSNVQLRHSHRARDLLYCTIRVRRIPLSRAFRHGPQRRVRARHMISDSLYGRRDDWAEPPECLKRAAGGVEEQGGGLQDRKGRCETQ